MRRELAVAVRAAVVVALAFLVAWPLGSEMLATDAEGFTEQFADLAPGVAGVIVISGLLSGILESLLARFRSPIRLFTVGQRSFSGWTAAISAMLAAGGCGAVLEGATGMTIAMVGAVITGLVPLTILVCLLMPVRWLEVGGTHLLLAPPQDGV